MEKMDKIRVIKLNSTPCGRDAYKVMIGDYVVPASKVTATVDVNDINLIRVNIEVLTADFEWKKEDEE